MIKKVNHSYTMEKVKEIMSTTEGYKWKPKNENKVRLCSKVFNHINTQAILLN